MLLSNNLKTTIKIDNSFFNINNLVDTIDSKTKIIKNKSQVNFDIPNLEIPEKFRFNVLNITNFNLVYIIENDIAFFTMFSYQDMIIKNNNINFYITSNDKYKPYLEIFYSNLYGDKNKYQNIIFTNKLFKDIPIKNIDVNTCYVLSDDYNVSKHYNCITINKHQKIENIHIEELEFQKFTDSSIIWFLNKIFKNRLNIYRSNNIVICSTNVEKKTNVEYVFLDKDKLFLLEAYFNWFYYSTQRNISLNDFIILIFGYYFQNYINNLNLYFNNHFVNNSQNTIGLKVNNNLIGLQIRNKINSSLKDFIEFITNNYGEVKIDTQISVSFENLVLIKGLNKSFINNNNYLLGLKHNENDIKIILSKYGFRNIWIFNDINSYYFINNHMMCFPAKNMKFLVDNNLCYKITNNIFNSYEYDIVKLGNYILELANIDCSENNNELSRVISEYNTKTIVSVLINNSINTQYFIDFYSKLGYSIVLINPFNIEVNYKNNTKVKVVSKLGSLKNNNNIVFIRPNYYCNNIASMNKKFIETTYYNEINKLEPTKIESYDKDISVTNGYIVDIELNLIERIKIEKLSNTILKNEYSGLF